jgi:hypothetical protein
MEEIIKTNNAAANVNCDADNLHWGTGKQEHVAAKYLRPANLSRKDGPKAAKFLKSGGDLVDIKPVKRLGTIEVRKPKRQEWFRTHLTLITEMYVLKDESSGDFYAVDPTIRESVGEDIREAHIVAAVNDEGALFLWPILKPKADGKGSQLYDNDLADISLSRTTWIRRQWISGKKSYETQETESSKEPAWPDNSSLEDWVEKGFKGRFIDDENHRLLCRLRGEL